MQPQCIKVSANTELLEKILAHRNVTGGFDSVQQLANLQNPELLTNADKACVLLHTALTQQQQITIVGDYDADGATATALMVRALADFGFHKVDYIVPNRMTDGYGLTEALLPKIVAKHTDLVITVDNGITSHKAIEQLREQHIEVIVTDHHLAGEQLPMASAIVNPNIETEHPLKNLAGVGVAYYLLLCLRKYLRQIDYFANREQPNLLQYIDLVALGTIADLVSLDANNRLICYQGLQLLRQNRGNIGMQVLYQRRSSAHISLISSEDIAFKLSPAINAAGRLEDISIGIQLLTTNDIDKAQFLAEQLVDINRQRKTIQKQGIEQALLQIEQSIAEQPNALFLEHCHQGVVGLVASKIVEKTGHPTIVITTKETDKSILVGSARSVAGLHIRDVLVAVSRIAPGLLLQFGGHAMAAGLTLKADNLQAFQQQFMLVCQSESYRPQRTHWQAEIDITANDLTLDKALALQAMVWGQGFAKPIFKLQLAVTNVQILYEKHIKWYLKLQNKPIQAISFDMEPSQLQLSQTVKKIAAYFYIDVNQFRDTLQLQLQIVSFQKLKP